MMCIIDIDTGEEFIFCTDAMSHEPKARPTEEFMKFIEDEAESVHGHFILGFDLSAIKKVYGWVLPKHIKKYDTMLMSQVLNYKRFGMRGHSLDVWGNFFNHKKPEHEDWLNYSPEMLNRCLEDCRINIKVWKKTTAELAAIMKKRPLLPRSIRIEHNVLEFCARAEENGWQFDTPAAKALLTEIGQRMKEIEDFIIPKLKIKTKIIDEEPKKPKWIKNGNYDAHTARYFGIDPSMGRLDDPPIIGEYQRFEYVQPDLGNLDSVKQLLDSLGWVPDDWNWKRGPNGEPIKGAPKLTTTSLVVLGEIGEKLDLYYTLRSRHQIVSGWVENVRDTGRLHGSCFTIATPTGRARHQGIVNVPAADGKSLYGAEIRRLFITRKGWKVVGADSAGNQMRAFCHYLRNEAYTKEVIEGDVHTANMLVLQEVVPETTRSKAKPFLYAFLFGGGAEKLALILIGKRDARIGKRAKDIFLAKTPGLKELVNRIMKVFDETKQFGEGWIPAIDGRRVYIDSPHKALNYLLQSCESVTCKAAVSMFMERMEKEFPHVPWNPLIFYHDEFEIECPEEYAEQIAVIMRECFRDAPKEFGVEIMDGASKVGDNWYDVH